MKKTLITLILASLAVGLFANGGAEAASTSEEGSQFVIGMSQCNLGEPWRVQMNADVKREADKHPELKVVFKDAQNDTLKQRSHVEEFVAMGVDLMIISPKEAQPLTAPVKACMDAGIPVIVLDRDLVDDVYTQFIGANNVKIGKAAGQWVAEKLNGQNAKIVELMGLQTSTPGQDRHNGFMEGLEGSDVEVIFRADVEWLEPNARAEMESALARYDNISLVYGHNDPASHGAYLAAKAMDRQDDIMFIGIDALPHEGVAYVQDGILDATFQYPTGGDVAVQQALKLLNGESIEKRIVLGSRRFDTENVTSGGEAIN